MIGIVGNVRAWKGQETVVRALIEVVKVHPAVVCFFIGATTPQDQPYMDRLNALITEAGIAGNVRFTGYQKDIPSLVNMLQFVIHASIQPEPFGMVVLEAMAQRKAVVGSRAGGVVEMVVEGETGYTFDPGNSTELADRVVTLLNDPGRASAMGQRGYQRLMTHFTLQQYMSQIHEAYLAVLDGRTVPLDGNRPATTA